jgi:hypothetical protein
VPLGLHWHRAQQQKDYETLRSQNEPLIGEQYLSSAERERLAGIWKEGLKLKSQARQEAAEAQTLNPALQIQQYHAGPSAETLALRNLHAQQARMQEELLKRLSAEQRFTALYAAEAKKLDQLESQLPSLPQARKTQVIAGILSVHKSNIERLQSLEKTLGKEKRSDTPDTLARRLAQMEQANLPGAGTAKIKLSRD